MKNVRSTMRVDNASASFLIFHREVTSDCSLYDFIPGEEKIISFTNLNFLNERVDFYSKLRT